MEESQFEELKSEIEHIQTNTSWTWYNNNELEKLNSKIDDIKDAFDENNELLRELIKVISNQRG